MAASPAFLIPVLNKWTGMNIQKLPHLPGSTTDFLTTSKQNRFTNVITLRYALHRAKIAHFARRAIGSLSGGERQRVQLARAIAQQPAVLFLDEPTNHLDPKARSELLSLVAGLDVTTIAVLHDLPLVAPFATHVAVMHSARLVATGTPDETLTPRIVSDVFDLDVLRLRHPSQDRDLMVFETPETSLHAHPRSI
jgi:iron complex transport system ATP-binding protein